MVRKMMFVFGAMLALVLVAGDASAARGCKAPKCKQAKCCKAQKSRCNNAQPSCAAPAWNNCAPSCGAPACNSCAPSCGAPACNNCAAAPCSNCAGAAAPAAAPVQAILISSSLIFNGGTIRSAFDANKNQSVKTPCAINASIIFLLVSKLSKKTAIIKPALLMLFIVG